MNEVGKRDLKELLIKGWMTHDGMWFYHSLGEVGIEKTNKINRSAVKSMGLVEIKRLKKVLGIESIGSFEELKSFTLAVFELVMGDFMKFTFEFKDGDVICAGWEDEKCFAYQGIKRIGAIEDYQCGIFDRIEAWFDGLGLKYTVSPEVSGCMMHTEGKCFREYRFDFGK